jgi:hypothetical protein
MQATVVRMKKDLKGENNARELSDALPFVEYEIHRQLVSGTHPVLQQGDHMFLFFLKLPSAHQNCQKCNPIRLFSNVSE